MKNKIKAALTNLGVPQHLKGYKYLGIAIRRVLENPDELDMLTKVLYPEIAKECGATPSRVERAMRHAIEYVFLNTDTDVINEVFGNSVPYGKGKVTNGHFIAAVADHLEA